jgi:hypothetical protein
VRVAVHNSNKTRVMKMRNLNLFLMLLVTIPAFAAKPVKITPGGEGATDGQQFRNYVVECSNGRKQPITSWDSGKRWCIGDASQENCAKKQIKAAKVACKKD